jgi:phospholipase/lecithinase/hemolysin
MERHGMRNINFRRQAVALALGTALLAGCNSDREPVERAGATERENIKVVVAGDSLADVGAYGGKATVQNADDPAAGFPIFPERVAKYFGMAEQCNFFAYDPESAGFTTNAACTNFAVGGSRIVNPVTRGGAAMPLNIPTQLEQAVAAAGGQWSGEELLLVDGGINDLSDLAITFIKAGRGDGELFRAMLLQLLDAAVVDPLLATGRPGAAEAGRLYMQALADTYHGAISTHALEHGARRVAVLNVPDIALTPRFRMVLDVVAETRDAAQADAARSIFRQWSQAYNAQLEARFAGDTRVAIVDFYGSFSVLVNHASRYGISNATQASCPSVSVDDLGLHDYTLSECSSAALDAALPDGLAPGWWRGWMFADDFHLSPFGHELLATMIQKRLVATGWW